MDCLHLHFAPTTGLGSQGGKGSGKSSRSGMWLLDRKWVNARASGSWQALKFASRKLRSSLCRKTLQVRRSPVARHLDHWVQRLSSIRRERKKLGKGTRWEHSFGVREAADLKLQSDGMISGHVGSADGKPFTVHPWVQIVSVDSERFMSAYVDARGHFGAKGVKPGRYVVGLGIRPGTGYFSDVPTLFTTLALAQKKRTL